MRQRIVIAALLMTAMMIAPAGCFKADVKLPKKFSFGSPPPAASIPQADPSNKADLLRENQQLRARTAWLDEQARKSARKYAELEDDQRKIQADIAKYTDQRDRYLRAAGR